MKSRSLASLAVAASLLASVSTASATVVQPNGTITPRDPGNGETQLYTLFSSRGEAIDWIADGASTPNTFSPLCGFTAAVVLKQSGATGLGLAWYNETGTAPQPSDLHTIIPGGSPVGTVITGASIKSDPAYAGGLVGFALVGAQTHYSNPAWNPVCTGCAPPAPWITTVIYPSKNIPNAFYLGFEDGSVGDTPGSFNNDGDYNDQVFLVTGVTCEGGGQTCDTGKPGVCAQGVTQCTASGTTCQQVSQPAAETCNNLDDNCDGQTDEGELCSAGNVCDKGVCVPKCRAGEFSCSDGKVCSPSGVCVDPKCKDVTCDSGKVCVQGTCAAPCDGVVCPGDQVCRNGACTDPCLGVTCESGQVCDKGVCVLRCDCLPCGAGNSCVVSSGRCVETACASITCNAGQRCAAGACVDACNGVVCPKGQACTAGECKAVPPVDTTPDGGGGGGLTGPGADPVDAGSGDPSGGAGAAPGPADASSGCGCVDGGRSANGDLAVAGLVVGVALVSRRRRKR